MTHVLLLRHFLCLELSSEAHLQNFIPFRPDIGQMKEQEDNLVWHRRQHKITKISRISVVPEIWCFWFTSFSVFLKDLFYICLKGTVTERKRDTQKEGNRESSDLWFISQMVTIARAEQIWSQKPELYGTSDGCSSSSTWAILCYLNFPCWSTQFWRKREVF